MPYERKTVDIQISDDLRNVLNVIEAESEVAALLLKRRHNREDLAESYVNYISISKQDRTKLSYLSQDRVDALDPQEYWTSSRRYMAKPGAFIAKLFNNVSAKEVEKFSNLFRSQAAKAPFRFEVVKGDAIKDFYYYESYQSNERGSLGVSCMKHEHCQKFFDLYTENQENVSMLAMFNDKNRLIGRALLWDFDSHKIMDRIYTYNDEELSFYFKQWATEHGYFYKSEQNWFNTLFFEQIGSGKKEFKLEVKLPNIKQHYYPYMDTFKFIDLDKGILYNYIPEDTSSLKTLTSSDGGKHPSDYLVFDEIDFVMRYRNDAAYITYLNIWTGRQNVIYSNYNDKWILNTDARYENLLDDYIFNEEHNDKNSERVLKLIEQRQKEEEARQEAYKKLKDKKDTKSLIEELDSVAATMRGWGDLTSVYGGGGIPNGAELRDMIRRTRPQRTRQNEEEVARPTRLEEVPTAEGREREVEREVPRGNRVAMNYWQPFGGTTGTTESLEGRDVEPTPEVPMEQFVQEEAPAIEERPTLRNNYFTDWYNDYDNYVTEDTSEDPF
jgi:hypothetical protein